MSRYRTSATVDGVDTSYAFYGYDRMINMPGYFLQITMSKSDYELDKYVVNEGFVRGLNRDQMLELVDKYSVAIPDDILTTIHMDLPI